MDLIVSWQPRCRTGVDVSNFPMQVVHPAETSGLFYHIHPLDDNEILWLEFVALIEPFDVVFAQFDLLKGHP